MGKRQEGKNGQKTSNNYPLPVAFCLLTVIFFILCSCSTVSVQFNSEPILINKVPFYPQEDYQCGPASLAGVLNYRGVSVTPDDVAKDIYSESARGTLNIDMLLYVNKKGLYALQYAGNWDDIKKKINNKYPLIVLVDYGFSVYQADHFMVIVGYNDDGVVVNSGKTEHMFIDKEKFLKAWKRTNYWTLLIKQKTEVSSQQSEEK
ncbi:MAG: C39 family peptidase [Nitrospiraceae bacterium]|nr:C39 family peptidase [Nitrospiraceae bacterium]